MRPAPRPSAVLRQKSCAHDTQFRLPSPAPTDRADAISSTLRDGSLCRNCLFSSSYVLRNLGMMGSTAEQRCQGIGFASLRVLDRLVCLCKPVIKAAMPPFANENQLRSKTFLISWPNYNKNKRSSQRDYERKSKHSKCSYTCEKRRGLTGISLQSSKQIR